MKEQGKAQALVRRFWKVGCGVGFVMWLCLLGSATAWAQTTIQVTGTAATKVYGQPSCNSNERLSFSWEFTPPGQIAPTQPAKFYIILGSNDIQNGIILQEGDLNTTGGGTGGVGGTVAITGSFTGNPDTNSEDKSKGMFEDGSLTIRDIIGFRAVADRQPAPTAATVCNLEPASSGGLKKVQIYVVADFQILDAAGGGATTRQEKAEGKLDVRFDLSPPVAPDKPTLSPSEKSLKVMWQIGKNETYDVFYSTSSFTPDKAATDAKKANTAAISGSTFTISGLENKKKYYVAIRAIDEAGNPGVFSEAVEGMPQELTDFYEAYRGAGGTDQGFSGGYCFIATAAYGTYDHKYVKILRDFRDKILLPTKVGRSFVGWYYRNSPAWAAWLRQNTAARWATKAMLLPLIGMAAFFVRLSGWMQLLIIGLLLLLCVRRWRQKSLGRAAKAAALLLVCAQLLQPGTAHAQSDAVNMDDDEKVEISSPRNFGFEFRAGPYRPAIDLSNGLRKGSNPYSTYFGDGSQLYLEAGFEWLFFKGFGSLGLAGSAGVTWATGEAKQATTTQPLVTNQTTDNNTETTTNTTSLWIIPLRLDLVYRFDYFTQRNRFPLVPYVRGGLDYSLWFITDPAGSLATFSSGGDTASAFGGRLGFHAGFGLQFLLDVIDPSTAKNFDVEMGVNHTYIFIEYNISWIGTFSDGMNLSDSGIRAGLMFQF